MPPRKTTRRRTTPPVTPRIKQKKRTRADGLRSRRHFLTALYFVLGVEIVAALLTSPSLSVKRVTVKGTEGLPVIEAQSAIQAAFVPAGVNEFLAPTGKIAARLCALPCVEKASVSRRFPDGLQANVVLRETVAIVQTSAGDFEIDRTGFPIRAARPEIAANFPHIALLRPRTVTVGVSLNDTALDAALDVLKQAANVPALQIAKIEVDLTDNLCLNMRDGIKARFGSPDDITKKVNLLAAAYRQEPNLAVRLLAINLSCPEWPACTPRKTASAPAYDTSKTKTTG